MTQSIGCMAPDDRGSRFHVPRSTFHVESETGSISLLAISVVNNAVMSHLFLVRHGQATFPYEDQDHLTEIGQAQAQLLGCFWAAEKI